MQDIYYSLVSEEQDRVTTFDNVVKKLSDHFSPVINIPYERHKFRSMAQNDNESIAQYVARLRQQAQLCNFSKVSEDLRDQVLEKCRSTTLRLKLLEQGTNLTLEKVLEISRILEMSTHQAELMESNNKPLEVNKLKVKHGQGSVQCYRCGSSTHKAYDKNCPAKGEECKKCGIMGHYAKQCRTKKENRKNGSVKQEKTKRVRQVEENKSDTEEEQYCFKVNVMNIEKNNLDVIVHVGGVPLEVLVTSGSN